MVESGEDARSDDSGTNSEPDEKTEEAPEEEDWVTWLERATGIAYRELQRAGVEEFAIQQKRNYRRWAGHITRMADRRWTGRILNWTPD